MVPSDFSCFSSVVQLGIFIIPKPNRILITSLLHHSGIGPIRASLKETHRHSLSIVFKVLSFWKSFSMPDNWVNILSTGFKDLDCGLITRVLGWIRYHGDSVTATPRDLAALDVVSRYFSRLRDHGFI